MQLFSVLSITLGKFLYMYISLSNRLILAVLVVHFANGAPVNSDASDEINTPLDEQNKMVDDDFGFVKRKLPVEGILIGRRAFPNEGILLGKREYPTEGILLGKRNYPMEGILLGKRNYPMEGILLGKRNNRFVPPKSSANNQYEN
jgi:hypothetical protein